MTTNAKRLRLSPTQLLLSLKPFVAALAICAAMPPPFESVFALVFLSTVASWSGGGCCSARAVMVLFLVFFLMNFVVDLPQLCLYFPFKITIEFASVTSSFVTHVPVCPRLGVFAGSAVLADFQVIAHVVGAVGLAADIQSVIAHVAVCPCLYFMLRRIFVICVVPVIIIIIKGIH